MSGRPRGLGYPSERGGAKPPTFCKGLRGPRDRPDPKHDRFPTFEQFKTPSSMGTLATVEVTRCNTPLCEEEDDDDEEEEEEQEEEGKE